LSYLAISSEEAKEDEAVAEEEELIKV
jgi:hypothetical protein